MKRSNVHGDHYLSGRVTRWHTWPTIHKPNVAEHQCRVAQLYCELWGLPRAEVLYYCINHDRGEQFAGDVPFGCKNNVPGLETAIFESETIGLRYQGVELPELTSDEHQRFKICDMLEMLEFCWCEQRMGNEYAEVPAADLRSKIINIARAMGDNVRVQQFMMERFYV